MLAHYLVVSTEQSTQMTEHAEYLRKAVRILQVRLAGESSGWYAIASVQAFLCGIRPFASTNNSSRSRPGLDRPHVSRVEAFQTQRLPEPRPFAKAEPHTCEGRFHSPINSHFANAGPTKDISLYSGSYHIDSDILPKPFLLCACFAVCVHTSSLLIPH